MVGHFDDVEDSFGQLVNAYIVYGSLANDICMGARPSALFDVVLNDVVV